MTKDFDAFERKQPTRVGGGCERRVHAVGELQQHRKVVDLVVLMTRSDRVQRFDLAEQEPHHVKHVNRRFVKEAAGDFRVAGPFGFQQLAAIHFDVC